MGAMTHPFAALAAVTVLALVARADGRASSAPEVGHTSASVRVLVRTCQSRVDAQRPANRSRDIVVGPVTLDGLGAVATQPASGSGKTLSRVIPFGVARSACD
jgi:hypothetical protein